MRSALIAWLLFAAACDRADPGVAAVLPAPSSAVADPAANGALAAPASDMGSDGDMEVGGDMSPAPWRWQTFSPQPAQAMGAIWASDRDDVWVGRTLMHFAHGTFTATTVTEYVTSIAGIASGDVYAFTIGDRPQNAAVYHFDGTRWTLVTRIAGPVNAALERSSDDLVIATTNGLFRSTDQGHTFAPLPLGELCQVEGVIGEGDEIDAVAVCDDFVAKLFRSVDGGGSFTAASIGTMQGLGLSGVGGTTYVTGYAVAADGRTAQKVLRTSDGHTFVDVSPGAGSGPLAAISPTEVWLAASGRGVLHTTDGGATWSTEFATEADLDGLFIGHDFVYAAASNPSFSLIAATR